MNPERKKVPSSRNTEENTERGKRERRNFPRNYSRTTVTQFWHIGFFVRIVLIVISVRESTKISFFLAIFEHFISLLGNSPSSSSFVYLTQKLLFLAILYEIYHFAVVVNLPYHLISFTSLGNLLSFSLLVCVQDVTPSSAGFAGSWRKSCSSFLLPLRTTDLKVITPISLVYGRISKQVFEKYHQYLILFVYCPFFFGQIWKRKKEIFRG